MAGRHLRAAAAAKSWEASTPNVCNLCGWLEGQLHAERKAMYDELERRHEELLEDLWKQLMRCHADLQSADGCGGQLADDKSYLKLADATERGDVAKASSMRTCVVDVSEDLPSAVPPKPPQPHPPPIDMQTRLPSVRTDSTASLPNSTSVDEAVRSMHNPKPPADLCSDSGSARNIPEAWGKGSANSQTWTPPDRMSPVLKEHRRGGSHAWDRARSLVLGQRAGGAGEDTLEDENNGKLMTCESKRGSMKPIGEMGEHQKQNLLQDGHFRASKQTYNNFYLQKLENCVRHPAFEVVFSVFILCNTCIMAAEVQWHGLELGKEVHRTKGAAVPWAGQMFKVFEWFFGLLFTFEVLVKALVLHHEFIYVKLEGTSESTSSPEWSRSRCLRCLQTVDWYRKHIDWWNVLDTLIVVFWIIGRFEGSFLPIDPMLLRLARLARLLRLLRLARTIQGFDSLYLMTATLKGSMSALLWSTILFFVLQMVLAFVLNELLTEYCKNHDNDLELRQRFYDYFGTFSRAVFTMFELTLGNWVIVGRLLMDHVSEWFMLFSVLHKCALGFAVVSVVRGVFMHETFRIAATDDYLMITQRNRAKKVHKKKMQRMFNLADEDQGGFLDGDEFAQFCTDPIMKTWLESMEIKVAEVPRVFELMTKDKDDKVLSCDELVAHMSALKGNARALDMAIMMHDNEKIKSMLEHIDQSLHRLGAEKVA